MTKVKLKKGDAVRLREGDLGGGVPDPDAYFQRAGRPANLGQQAAESIGSMPYQEGVSSPIPGRLDAVSGLADMPYQEGPSSPIPGRLDAVAGLMDSPMPGKTPIPGDRAPPSPDLADWFNSLPPEQRRVVALMAKNEGLSLDQARKVFMTGKEPQQRFGDIEAQRAALKGMGG